MGPGSYGGWTPEKSHGWEGEQIPLTRSYFDQEPFVMPLDGSKIILRNRKISTYVNAMAKAGFCLEQMVEETSREALRSARRICCQFRWFFGG